MTSGQTQAVRDGIVAEGSKWARLADDIAAVNTTVRGYGLDVAAFFDGELLLAQQAKASYDDLLARFVALTGGAATEFDQINEALRRAADLYDAADANASAELDQIYGKDAPA